MYKKLKGYNCSDDACTALNIQCFSLCFMTGTANFDILYKKKTSVNSLMNDWGLFEITKLNQYVLMTFAGLITKGSNRINSIKK